MLDSIFLPQTPDRGQSRKRPVCPDCGGTGDLRQVIGTFEDTRVMRPNPVGPSEPALAACTPCPNEVEVQA